MIDIDIDDYKKLSMLMKYIKYHIGLPLIISIDNIGNIKWYVDAEFVVLKYKRGHTDGFMSMVTV